MTELPPALEHGPLEPVGHEVWRLQGTVRMAPGMVINRNMVVLRWEGSLTVIDAVRPDDATTAQLEALGRVEHVVKLGSHGMDDPWFVDRFGARTAAPGCCSPATACRPGPAWSAAAPWPAW